MTITRSTSNADLPRQLDRAELRAHTVRQLADRVVAQVPSCVGISLSPNQFGLTWTSAATDGRAAALDSVQYLGDGPCVEAAVGGVQAWMDEALTESRWEEYALAAASLGVRSSLSLPFVDGEVRGAVNMYGADPEAFARRHDELQALVDRLDLTDVDRPLPPVAQQAPPGLYERDLVESAIGYLAASRRLSLDQGRELLEQAAARARVDLPLLAKVLLHVPWDADTPQLQMS